MDTFLAAQESSFTGLHLEVPDSPPHATPACDPLPCLTSLCHSLLLSGALNLPSAFCQGLLLHPPGLQTQDSGEETSTDGGVGHGESEQSLLCFKMSMKVGTSNSSFSLFHDTVEPGSRVCCVRGMLRSQVISTYVCAVLDFYSPL